jgi:hypothetical protein
VLRDDPAAGGAVASFVLDSQTEIVIK